MRLSAIYRLQRPPPYREEGPVNIRNAQSGTCPLETATSENAELEIRSRSFFAFNTNCCIKAAIVTDGAQLSSGQLLEKILDNAVGLCYRYENSGATPKKEAISGA